MKVEGGRMSHCEQEERALLYALGLLEGAEANLFESHIKECAICQADVRESGDLAGPPVCGGNPEPPQLHRR